MGGIVFFDGGCALCHWAVRWIMRIDAAGAFRYAPLGGETFQRMIGDRAGLPDSLVLLDSTGQVFVRSDAALRVLASAGPWWRALARLFGAIPRPMRDALYDAVARVRFRLFGRAREACPLAPPELRSRILP